MWKEARLPVEYASCPPGTGLMYVEELGFAFLYCTWAEISILIKYYYSSTTLKPFTGTRISYYSIHVVTCTGVLEPSGTLHHKPTVSVRTIVLEYQVIVLATVIDPVSRKVSESRCTSVTFLILDVPCIWCFPARCVVTKYSEYYVLLLQFYCN